MVLGVQIPRLRSQRPVSACRIALSLLVAATGCGQRTTATNPGAVERGTPADATAAQHIVAEYRDGSPVRLVDAEAESNFIRVRVVDGSVLVDNPAGRPLEQEVLLRVVDESNRSRSVVVVAL
jgi:hypothetical protein